MGLQAERSGVAAIVAKRKSERKRISRKPREKKKRSKKSLKKEVAITKTDGTIEKIDDTTTVYRLSDYEKAEREKELQAQRNLKRKSGTLDPRTQAQIQAGTLKIYRRDVGDKKLSTEKYKKISPSVSLKETTGKAKAVGTALVTGTVAERIERRQKQREAERKKRLGGARVYKKVGRVQKGSFVISESKPKQLKETSDMPIKGEEVTKKLIPVEPLTEKSKPGLITPRLKNVILRAQEKPTKRKPVYIERQTAVLSSPEPVAFITGEQPKPASTIEKESKKLKAKDGFFISDPERFENLSDAIMKRQSAFYSSPGIKRIRKIGNIGGAFVVSAIKSTPFLSRPDITGKITIKELYKSESEKGLGRKTADEVIGGVMGSPFYLGGALAGAGEKIILIGRGIGGGVIKPRGVALKAIGYKAPVIPETASFPERLILRSKGVFSLNVEGASIGHENVLSVYKKPSTYISAAISAGFVAGGITLAKRAPIKIPKNITYRQVNRAEYSRYTSLVGKRSISRRVNKGKPTILEKQPNVMKDIYKIKPSKGSQFFIGKKGKVSILVELKKSGYRRVIASLPKKTSIINLRPTTKYGKVTGEIKTLISKRRGILKYRKSIRYNEDIISSRSVTYLPRNLTSILRQKRTLYQRALAEDIDISKATIKTGIFKETNISMYRYVASDKRTETTASYLQYGFKKQIAFYPKDKSLAIRYGIVQKTTRKPPILKIGLAKSAIFGKKGYVRISQNELGTRVILAKARVKTPRFFTKEVPSLTKGFAKSPVSPRETYVTVKTQNSLLKSIKQLIKEKRGGLRQIHKYKTRQQMQRLQEVNVPVTTTQIYPSQTPILRPEAFYFGNLSQLGKTTTALSVSLLTATVPTAKTIEKSINKEISKSENISRIKTISPLKQINIVGLRKINLSTTKIKTPFKEMQITGTDTILQPQLTPNQAQSITGGAISVNLPTPNIPETPIPPPPVIPSFDLPDDSEIMGVSKKVKKGKRKYRYTPTISAGFAGLTGEIPKGQLSGLEQRPLRKGYDPLRGLR